MKKIIAILAVMLGIGMGASAYSTSAVFLQHKGNITTYEPEAIQEALDAAEDGDVVLLNEGTFPGFEIKKRISVKGAGPATIIAGDILVSIPADTTRLTSNLLESICVGEVKIPNAINGVKFYKCTIHTIECHLVDNMIIDRCYINGQSWYSYGYTVKGLLLPYYGGRLTVINSKINDVGCGDEGYYWGNGKRTTFINCNINNITCPYIIDPIGFAGTIRNSILDGNGYKLGKQCILENNLFNSKRTYLDNSCITSNNYFCKIDDDFVLDSNNECTYDTETLISKGYLGNDGTVVGIYGGATPYTLEPSVPKVVSSQMQLDKENKKLNVTLTVSPK